jgi:purine-nucleoside phosphorylase
MGCSQTGRLATVSTHIGAGPGEIAPVVLLPGDPKRAQWIAETFLEEATCYSEVRGMLGFTGTWHGTPVSVQGSGMGQPSMAIYVNELFREYHVASIIRVGSCGGLSDKVALRDVIIASGACTDSSMNRITFEGLDYAPVADFGLLRAAVEAAQAKDREAAIHVGLIFSCDSFYASRPELMARMVGYGVLGVEMEASALYTLAAKHGRKALAISTVSDHVLTGEATSTEERERTLADMVDIALSAAVDFETGHAHSGVSMDSSSARPGNIPGSTTRPLRTK